MPPIFGEGGIHMPDLGDILGGEGLHKHFEAAGNLVNTIIHELESAAGKPELFQGLQGLHLGHADHHAMPALPGVAEGADHGLVDLVHLPNGFDPQHVSEYHHH